MEHRSEAERRRATQREQLIAAAEAAIAAEGLGGLRARRLAETIGCSVGAIYNLVSDLDELVLLVAQRTFLALGVALDAALPDDDTVEARFTAWARAYLAFAAANRNRWRALFEFRLADAERPLPAWFAADQEKLFERLETGLADLCPGVTPAARTLRARTLFSAVHGIVALGLEEKLVALPAQAVEVELVRFIVTYVGGLRTELRTSP